MTSKKPFYLTTAIAYTNAGPHLGFALELIEADAIARYRRLAGDDVYFVTGTDEHGIKNYNTAKAAGVDTLAFVQGNADIFKRLKGILDLSYDDFIQTTDRERHWPAAQKLWRKLEERGDITLKEYEGLYCEGCELFLKETELESGLCPIHKKAPQLAKEANYFFRLSKYSQRIVELIEGGTLRLIPESRQAEFLNMAKEGLHDVSFSRPRSVLPWGIDVPGDPSHVMYVWCDALTNYISALDYANDGPLFQKYWPAQVHVIGKDIVRFHAGVWIGMLLSAEIDLPKSILIHGFVTHNGEKMSKSLGNVVDPIQTAEKYGVDALRYYLLREIPTGKDGDYSDSLFVERYNSDLANNLGNLVNRLHTLVSRNAIEAFRFDQHQQACQAKTEQAWAAYRQAMDGYDLHGGVAACWELVNFANKRLEEEKPWSTIKTDRERGVATLCNLLEALRHITLMLHPLLPGAAQKIRAQIGLLTDPLEEAQQWGGAGGWSKLGEQAILFPRREIGKD